MDLHLWGSQVKFNCSFIVIVCKLIIGFESGLDRRISNATAGGFTYRIHGSLYHQIGSILPPDKETPKFSSLYFYDQQQALTLRQNLITTEEEIEECRDIMEKIQEEILANNQLVKIYKQRGLEALDSPEKIMVIHDNYKKIDIRTYNRPSDNDIAAIIPADPSQCIGNRDVIVEQRSGLLKRIHHSHTLSQALNYVILFPHGTPGWNYEMKQDYRITLRNYVNYYLQIRDGHFNTLFKGGRLSHQWVCEQYVNIQADDLKFVKQNQNKFRVERYKGLVDSYFENLELRDIGKMYILPSSFKDGPRYYHQMYLDAMEVVMKMGGNIKKCVV